jgi:hypothetical protein
MLSNKKYPAVQVVSLAINKLQQKPFLDQIAWALFFFNTLGLITMVQIFILKN